MGSGACENCKATTDMNNTDLDTKQILKRLTLIGLGRLAVYCRAQIGAILCLHSISDDVKSEGQFHPRRHLVTSTSFIESLIADLRRLNFDLVSVEDAIARLKYDSSRPFVAFTLDDGYADNFTAGYPIFSRYQVPFTVFVTTGFVDRTVPMWWVLLDTLIRQRDYIVLPHGSMPTHDLREKNSAYATINGLIKSLDTDQLSAFFEELLDANPGTEARADSSAAPLTWAQLRTMAATGLVTVGCHTVTHLPLSRLDQETCETEIFVARDRIKVELGEAPRFFAYPFGGPSDVGSAAPEIVAKAKFEAAFGLNRALLARLDAETASYFIPRIVLDSEDLLLTRAYISGLPWALRNSLNRVFGRLATRKRVRGWEH
jgi:peptidoglycan/xylan/chitin deacetylase (PgdA/CDA1 family)